jgi:hypothetical protein
MSQFYQILKADPLGDPYTPNFQGAKATQTYWCQFDGVDKDVSMGKQVGNVPIPGSHVYGDLLYAKSQKGNEYWKFKSAKVPDGVQRPASAAMPTPAAAHQEVGGQTPGWFQPWANLLQETNKMVKELHGGFQEPELPPARQGVEQLGGDPLDEVTQARLDDIFTPELTPEDAPEPEQEV